MSSEKETAINPEQAEIDKIEEAGRNALLKSYETIQGLGDEGLKKDKTNQHNEQALTGDWESEEAVIQFLKEAGISFCLFSEEHGEEHFGENPEYTIILDGLDGTAEYRKNRETGRYGTMLAIYKGTNPQYQDYLFGGIMEHGAARIYWAAKDKSAWSQTGKSEPQKLNTSQLSEFNSRSCLIHADVPYDTIFGGNMMREILAPLENFKIIPLLSSAIHYADLLDGKVQAVIEGTRKGNLEIAVAFALISEAGGTMGTIENGNFSSLDKKTFLEFGQEENDHFPIVSFANNGLIKPFIENQKLFSEKKGKYFFNLALSLRKALKLHRSLEAGNLWEKAEIKDPNIKTKTRDWGNVSEHCLVEAARVRVLSQLLALPGPVIDDLLIAAALHDFYKRHEIFAFRSSPYWETYMAVNQEAEAIMHNSGFSDEVIKLAGAVGHASYRRTEEILARDITEPYELAFLCLHYIDDYTQNFDWTNPSGADSSGHKISDLNRRLEAIAANQKYKELLESTRSELGENIVGEYIAMGEKVEAILAQRLSDRLNSEIDPKTLPEFIDSIIIKEINKLELRSQR